MRVINTPIVARTITFCQKCVVVVDYYMEMFGIYGLSALVVTLIWLVQATASALWHASVTLRGTGAPPLRRSPQNGRCRTFRNAVRAMEENVGRGAGDE